jgi:RimJ/RimL family protein N-acetyltransferase
MVKLSPLNEADFQKHLAFVIDDYARDHVAAGNWPPEGARERSKQEFDKLLPQGLATPGHYLFSVYDEALSQNVGLLWFEYDERRLPPSAFIYDFLIDEAYRRQGYGRLALLALEDKAMEMGIGKIGLHVFGHNHAARALYEQLGYEVTDLRMSKMVEGV